MKTYLKANWKRLLVANLLSFAAQGMVFAVLTALGVDLWLSTVMAKSASWLGFLGQVAYPIVRKALG